MEVNLFFESFEEVSAKSYLDYLREFDDREKYERILNCPFCGGYATLFKIGQQTDIEYRDDVYAVVCDDWNAMGGSPNYRAEDAIRAWNRREK